MKFKLSLRGATKERRSNPFQVIIELKGIASSELLRFAAQFFLAMTIIPTLTAQAQHLRIYACAIGNDSTGASMGGSSNGSGLYQSDDTGKTWRHLGWDNIKCYSMDMVQSSNGRILYEATGLGILRSTDYGVHWKQITDWRISEAMDVAVNQKNPNEIYIATAHGSWRSEDGGKKWEAIELDTATSSAFVFARPKMDSIVVGSNSTYCSRVVFDTPNYSRVVFAADAGIFIVEKDNMKAKRITGSPIRVTSIGQRIGPLRHEWVFGTNGYGDWGSYDSLTTSEQEVKEVIDWARHYNTGHQKLLASMWCVSDCEFYNQSEHEWETSVVLGGSEGVLERTHVSDMVLQSFYDSVRSVSACLQVNLTLILGSLDGGVYNDDAQELPYRQIWTLKSFHVTP